MDFFKVFLVKSKDTDEIVSELSKLCSEYPKFISFPEKEYVGIKYNPDVYFSNLNSITNLFSKGLLIPLLMTNYKFLRLLKETSNLNLKISSWELDQGDDEEFEDMILYESKGLELLKDHLDKTYQKIKYFEFKYNDNRIKISQTGVVSITERFQNEDEKNFLLEKVIGVLVEGEMYEEV